MSGRSSLSSAPKPRIPAVQTSCIFKRAETSKDFVLGRVFFLRPSSTHHPRCFNGPETKRVSARSYPTDQDAFAHSFLPTTRSVVSETAQTPHLAGSPVSNALRGRMPSSRRVGPALNVLSRFVATTIHSATMSASAILDFDTQATNHVVHWANGVYNKRVTRTVLVPRPSSTRTGRTGRLDSTVSKATCPPSVPIPWQQARRPTSSPRPEFWRIQNCPESTRARRKAQARFAVGTVCSMGQATAESYGLGLRGTRRRRYRLRVAGEYGALGFERNSRAKMRARVMKRTHFIMNRTGTREVWGDGDEDRVGFSVPESERGTISSIDSMLLDAS
uniref:Uncharacterized protein n=1 Tax=Mycena chlorophos TaxID=658473 RepID=A0ABQ0KZ87_MYCCL|nr:predicted protein [Mycena chlorophos]